MYIHEKLMLCALDLLNKYHLETIDVVGELCQAGHTLAAFSDDGIRKLHDELKELNSNSAEEQVRIHAEEVDEA